MTWRERHENGPDGPPPDFLIQRQAVIPGKATTASTEYWRTFALARLRAIHSIVEVAGTATGTAGTGGLDDAAGYTIYGLGTGIGTSSIAQVTFGTNAAEVTYHGTFTSTMSPNEGLRFLKGADADLVATFYIEYEVLPDAVMS